MTHLKRSFANECFVTIRAEIAPRIARVQQVKEHYDMTQREPADEREKDRDAKIIIVRLKLAYLLQLDKYEFLRHEVTYLEHIIGKE